MASDRWTGFTDEDIARIKSNPNLTKSCSDRICELDGYSSASKSRGPMKIKKLPMKTDINVCPDDMYEVNANCSKSRSKDSPPPYTDVPTLTNTGADFRMVENAECTCSNYMFEDDQREIPVSVDSTNTSNEANDAKCEEFEQSNANLLPLEIFEMRQKRIEAENARRRALISKAINDKKMQTHAEAIKLAKITQELNRIDSNLSADVSILRDYIEKASLEFSEAEKRYLKAEKEYVEAKLVLFEKMQRKEMLTEHLCSIIEQNENRKADKLVELMKQLEMEVIVEDYDVNGVQSQILPNLCALNDDSYQSCQTIKPTISRENLPENTVTIPNQKQECDDQIKDAEVSIDENIPNDVSIKTSSSVEELDEEKV